MSWLEFFSSIVASVAWPTVAITAFMLFKEALLQAVPRLNRLKYKELVAEFDRGLEKIEREVKDAGLEKIEAARGVDDTQENLGQLAVISPNAAVVEAFRLVEKSAKGLLRAYGTYPDYKVAAPYRLIEQLLGESGALGSREVKLFRDLRLLRNRVTHTETFEASHTQAVEYVELAALLISKIEFARARKEQNETSNLG